MKINFSLLLWRTLRNHPLMAVVGLLAFVAAFVIVAPLLTGQQQRVSLLKKKGLLMGAYQEFTNAGSIRTFSSCVSLSSNTADIDGTQYRCFVELRYGEGTLAMTTNFAFVWRGPNGVAKLIPTDDPQSRQ
jgi:hypothetical protein